MLDQLVPNKHYILLKDDYTDTQERLEWAIDHPDQCEQISRRATAFMNQFMDEDVERALLRDVVRKYFNMPPIGPPQGRK